MRSTTFTGHCNTNDPGCEVITRKLCDFCYDRVCANCCIEKQRGRKYSQGRRVCYGCCEWPQYQDEFRPLAVRKMYRRVGRRITLVEARALIDHGDIAADIGTWARSGCDNRA